MINAGMKCEYPCKDIYPEMKIPHPDIDPEKIRMILISEAPPAQIKDFYYQDNSGSFFQTTRMAFSDAGVQLEDYDDLTRMGIYLTTAIKCSKKTYLVSRETIKNCSIILEKEISQFPHLQVIMCMGDFAIKAINIIYKKKFGIMPIRQGSTYKIRKEVYQFKGVRFFPSYTQTGDSFNLEKSKRKMIVEDIRNALMYLKKDGI